MYGEEIKIDKFKVLLQAYRYLAEELRYANTPLRNQTKYFNRLFDDYRGTEKEDKKNNRQFKLEKQLDKLAKKSYLVEIYSSSISRNLSFGQSTTDSYRAKARDYLKNLLGDEPLPINKAMEKIVKEYSHLLWLQKVRQEREEEEKRKEEEEEQRQEEEKRKEEVVRQKQKKASYGHTNDKEISSYSVNSSEKRNLDTNTPNKTASAKQIYREINKKKKTSYNFNNLSRDIKDIIDALIRLRKDNRRSMTELSIEWRKEALKELISLHTILKAKNESELTEDEKVILTLLNFSKYNPLNILKNYEKKHPEHFSYSKIVSEAKEKLKEYTKQLQSYGDERKSVIFNTNNNNNDKALNLHDFDERELYVKKIEKYIRRHKYFYHHKFKELSYENSQYISMLAKIKFLSINDKTNDELIEWYNNSHIELIYKYLILMSKKYKCLTDEEKVLLSLFNSKQFNPLNLLKQNEKKYPEHFSYSGIIESVNKKIVNDIEKMFDDPFIYKYVNQLPNRIPVMTNLMSLSEIDILYTRLVNKDLNRNGEGMRSYYLYENPKSNFSQLEALQYVFADAIKANPNYHGFSTEGMNDEQISKFRAVERMYICAKYFHHLPAYDFINSKEELCTYIMENCPSKEIATSMCNEIMNIDHLYDEHHHALASLNNKSKKM